MDVAIIDHVKEYLCPKIFKDKDDAYNYMTQQMGIHEKGWGTEYVYALGPSYCGKILHFAKGGRTSFHFHTRKDETLFAQSGDFKILFINTMNGSREEVFLSRGQI